VIAAENGATAHQLKAIFGWITLKQPELYTRSRTKASSRRRHATVAGTEREQIADEVSNLSDSECLTLLSLLRNFE
jgi:hypothetical protein